MLPSLIAASAASIVTNGVSSFASGEEIGGPGSLWADEEDKKFYEELRELRGEVPGNILGVLLEKEVVPVELQADEAESIEESKNIEGGEETVDLESVSSIPHSRCHTD